MLGAPRFTVAALGVTPTSVTTVSSTGTPIRRVMPPARSARPIYAQPPSATAQTQSYRTVSVPDPQMYDLDLTHPKGFRIQGLGIELKVSHMVTLDF